MPAATPQPPVEGDVIADRYRVCGELGRGGMGVVLLAENVVTGKQVALKWLRAGTEIDVHAMQRLVREARIAARVHHPNVIDVYDVGEHEGALFLVAERLKGIPLSDALHEGPVPADALIATLLPVLEGLAAAHRQGVVHRDLKPSNIFLCVDDRGHDLAPKLLDFGISKIDARTGVDGEPTLTATGGLLGTPEYMAPEQLDEARTVDHRADIYSMGVLLYRALSGELPYRADSYSTLILRIATGDRRSLREQCPTLDPRLSAAIEKSLSLEPAARFQDVAGLADALRPYAGSRPLHATTPVPQAPMGTSPASQPTRELVWSRSRLTATSIGIALLVLLVVLGQRLLSERNPTDDIGAGIEADVAPTNPVSTPPPAAATPPPGDPIEPATPPSTVGTTAPPSVVTSAPPKSTQRRRRSTPAGTSPAKTILTKPTRGPLDLQPDEF